MRLRDNESPISTSCTACYDPTQAMHASFAFLSCHSCPETISINSERCDNCISWMTPSLCPFFLPSFPLPFFPHSPSFPSLHVHMYIHKYIPVRYLITFLSFFGNSQTPTTFATSHGDERWETQVCTRQRLGHGVSASTRAAA